MSTATMTDLAALMAGAFGGVEVDATAGGTGDATEVSGAYQLVEGAQGVTIPVFFTTTLAEGETLTIAGNLQDADDTSGANVADYGTAVTATVVATGPSGGGTVTGCALFSFDLSAAKEAIRIQFTPNLSAGGTDTATMVYGYLFHGHRRNPVSRSNLTRLN